MNKKGNIYLGVFIGIMIFTAGVFAISFLMDDITTTRADLNCTSSDISDGTKLLCLQTDTVIPYFIWFFTSLFFGYLIGRNT